MRLTDIDIEGTAVDIVSIQLFVRYATLVTMSKIRSPGTEQNKLIDDVCGTSALEYASWSSAVVIIMQAPLLPVRSQGTLEHHYFAFFEAHVQCTNSGYGERGGTLMVHGVT